MLNSIRQNTKSLLWIVIVAFVLGSLGLIGIGSARKSNSQDVAAVVNGEPISFTSLEQQFRNLYNFYRQIYGENLTQEVLQNMRLEETALDQLVEKELLVQAAKDYQLQVSEQELITAIHDIPQFQIEGRFDPDTYTTLLTRSRMTPQDFEALIVDDLLTEKIGAVIKRTVQVSAQEVQIEYVAENEKVKVAAVLVKPEKFRNQVTVDDDEIAAYYAEMKEDFTTPPRIKIGYVAFTPEQFIESVSITEEEIQEYYATHEAEFNKGKEVKARHILLRVADDADEETEAAVQQQIVEIRGLVEEGRDFADLAKTYSEDPGSAENGGDLGFFSKGMMVPEFEAAAFALEPGQVSEPVRTQFGYHLLQVEEIREDTDPYATVKPLIEERLKSEQAKALAQKRADEAYQMLLEKKELQQVAESLGVTAAESQFFGQGEPIDDTLSVNWQVQNVAMTLSMTNPFSQPVETSTGSYLLELRDTKDPYVPELSEITEEVSDAVTQKKARELALAEAQNLKSRLADGTSWEEVSASEIVEMVTPEPFSRRSSYLYEFGGNADDVIAAAFSLEEQTSSDVIELPAAYCLVYLEEKLAIDASEFEAQKADLTQQLLSQKQNLVFDEFVEELKQNAEIKISELLQQAGEV
jgi:peptidyl-prolyl cis-trans isomerase D